VALGVPGRFKDPDHLDIRHYNGGRSSAIRTGRLHPRRNPWYSLSEAESTSVHIVLSEWTTEKIPSDTIRNRSRDRLVAQRLNHYATLGLCTDCIWITVRQQWNIFTQISSSAKFWLDIYLWGAGLAVTRRIRDITLDRTFYSLLFKQEVVEVPVAAKLSSLSHSSRRPLLEI
jgi:hypothetical protein